MFLSFPLLINHSLLRLLGLALNPDTNNSISVTGAVYLTFIFTCLFCKKWEQRLLSHRVTVKLLENMLVEGLSEWWPVLVGRHVGGT